MSKTTTRTILMSACVMLSAVALFACTPPQVQLKRADLAKLTTTGFRVDMNLAIFNPNTYTLPLKSIGWNLALFKAPFTSGTVGTANQVAANRTTPVRVPLGIRFASAKSSIQKFLSGRDIPWGIGGKCNFNTPAGPIFVQFAKEGNWTNPLKGRISEHDALHEVEQVAHTAPLIQISLKDFEKGR